MNIKEHTTPDQLERYSFLWSEIRLIIASVALFIGGIPPIVLLNPLYTLRGLVSLLLTLSWIVSGLASAYLIYRWNKGGKMLFGGKKPLDLYTFFIMVISGLNLGLAGLLGNNIGMSIFSNRLIFTLTGIVYLFSLFHLNKRFKENNKKIFSV